MHSYKNKRKIKDKKVSSNLSYNSELYMQIKMIAFKQHKYLNALIEEGMEYLCRKYKTDLPEEYQNK